MNYFFLLLPLTIIFFLFCVAKINGKDFLDVLEDIEYYWRNEINIIKLKKSIKLTKKIINYLKWLDCYNKHNKNHPPNWLNKIKKPKFAKINYYSISYYNSTLNDLEKEWFERKPELSIKYLIKKTYMIFLILLVIYLVIWSLSISSDKYS